MTTTNKLTDNSPLTAAQWSKLESLAQAANDAVSALSLELLLTAAKLDSDPELQTKLMTAAESMPCHGVAQNPYFYHCQSEWMGNDAKGEGIFKLREPHIADRLPRREVRQFLKD